MTRDDLFDKNANVVKAIAEAASEVAPKAILGIITNPVNSCVPIACEVFKKVIVIISIFLHLLLKSWNQNIFKTSNLLLSEPISMKLFKNTCYTTKLKSRQAVSLNFLKPVLENFEYFVKILYNFSISYIKYNFRRETIF